MDSSRQQQQRSCPLTSRPEGAGEEQTLHGTQVRARALTGKDAATTGTPEQWENSNGSMLCSFLGSLPLAQPSWNADKEEAKQILCEGVSLLGHKVGQIKLENEEGTREDAV